MNDSSTNGFLSVGRRARGNLRSYTLTEMLVVVFVLMLLLALMAGLTSYVQYRAAEARVRADIRNIDNWLQAYRNDTGIFPINALTFTASSTTLDYWTNAGTLSSRIFRALYYNPSLGIGPVKTPYCTFRAEQLRPTNPPYSANTQIVDPWDTPICYDAVSPYPEVRKNPTYDVWSFGPNRLSDRGTASYNKDDIGNFLPP